MTKTLHVSLYLIKIKKLLEPAKGFNVVATMNGVPDDLPEALADRFAVKIDINNVHPDAIETLPEQYKGAYAREAVIMRQYLCLSVLGKNLQC